MAEIPSSYLIDKASKAKDELLADSMAFSLENKADMDLALAVGLSTPETGKNSLFSLDGEDDTSESPTMQERIENAEDVTLTDLEKSLTTRQRKFAWGLADARSSGKVNLTQIALSAGYSEGQASKKGSALSRHPVICQVVAQRIPVAMKLKAIKERGPDFVIEKAAILLERAMQETAVLDKSGQPTGYFIYDGALAMRCLDSLANWMGMTKTKVEMSGNDGDAIKIDSKVVQVQVLSMADRIRSSSVKIVDK